MNPESQQTLGDENLRKLPALGVSALALHHLNYLIADPIPAVALYRTGVLVQIPRPERFAIHKLIVADRRLEGPDALKARKDRLQADFLIDALAKERPDDLAEAPIETTRHLARIVESQLPRAKPGQAHPATRSFQAIRIAVNDEFGELAAGLEAAERALNPGGRLAVVTFHSLEDRMVKRFMQDRAGKAGQGSRHAPPTEADAPGFTLLTRKAVGADADELQANPRSRSARLRVARRTEAPARAVDRGRIGMPILHKGARH